MTAGVLVLHPWWGLNDDVRAYAERLRGQGYQVATPDLYHGRVATTIDAAKALQGPLSEDWKRAMSEIEEAHTKLSAQADRVAPLAWSMGVWLSWQLAQARPNQVHGLVSYYGLGETEAGKALPPILGHFAEDDEFESLADVRSTEQKLVESGAVATGVRQGRQRTGVAADPGFPRAAPAPLTSAFADAPNGSRLAVREA